MTHLSTPTKASPHRSRIVRLIRDAFIAYLLITLAVYFLQGYMIFPGSFTRAKAILPPGRDYDLLSLKAPDGKQIAVIFGLALDRVGATRPDAGQRPTILYFYGNGQCLADSKDIFDDFRRRGFNVILPEYEGYAMSQGNPTEAGCYAAADAAYGYLLSRNDVPPQKFVAIGWSLGSAVATDLAHRKPISRVATLSAFTSMDEMAHKTIPWLPTSLLLRHHFDNLAKIQTLDCPLFIASGTNDHTVPPEMSDRLARSAKGPVTRLRIKNADHDDIFEIGGEDLMNQLQHFAEDAGK